MPASGALPADAAYVEFATTPVTLPPATLFAIAAKPTCPPTFAPVILVKLAPSPDTDVNVPRVADILPTETLPVTVSEVKVPTEVILGCAAVVTVPAVVAVVADVALDTAPETLDPTILDKPPPSPDIKPVFAVMLTAVINPLTSNPVKVPTDVMFPCAAVVTVCAVVAVVADDTAPTTLLPDTLFATAANPTSPDTLPPATAFAVAANDT